MYVGTSGIDVNKGFHTYGKRSRVLFWAHWWIFDPLLTSTNIGKLVSEPATEIQLKIHYYMFRSSLSNAQTRSGKCPSCSQIKLLLDAGGSAEVGPLQGCLRGSGRWWAADHRRLALFRPLKSAGPRNESLRRSCLQQWLWSAAVKWRTPHRGCVAWAATLAPPCTSCSLSKLVTDETFQTSIWVG